VLCSATTHQEESQHRGCADDPKREKKGRRGGGIK
jgi:hypothetical protein